MQAYLEFHQTPCDTLFLRESLVDTETEMQKFAITNNVKVTKTSVKSAI